MNAQKCHKKGCGAYNSKVPNNCGTFHCLQDCMDWSPFKNCGYRECPSWNDEYQLNCEPFHDPTECNAYTPISEKPPDFRELVNDIISWADDAIGKDRTAENALTKMVMEEIPELLHAEPIDLPLEAADIGILFFDYCHLKGIDIFEAMAKKHAINKKRSWERDPNTGLIHHVTKN